MKIYKHKIIIRRTIQILFISLFCSYPLVAQQDSTRDDFLNMARYFSAGSGKWITYNPNFDPQRPKSAKSFELWFRLSLRDHLLHLTHVVYTGESTRVTGESFWLWHPGEQRIKYYSKNIRGGTTNGTTFFQNPKQFTTQEYAYSTDGLIEIHKDVNIIISENEHKTTTYAYRKGIWEKTGTYKFEKYEE